MTRIIIFIAMMFTVWDSGAKEAVHNCEWPEYQNSLTALACNVYHEARNQSRAGKLSVGFVTLNRVKSVRFPDNIVDVVYQRKQFSWHSDGRSDKVYDLSAWLDSVHIATYLLSIRSMDYAYVDITDGSLFYHTKKVSPKWACKRNLVLTIDDHMFYSGDVKDYERC